MIVCVKVCLCHLMCTVAGVGVAPGAPRYSKPYKSQRHPQHTCQNALWGEPKFARRRQQACKRGVHHYAANDGVAGHCRAFRRGILYSDLECVRRQVGRCVFGPQERRRTGQNADIHSTAFRRHQGRVEAVQQSVYSAVDGRGLWAESSTSDTISSNMKCTNQHQMLCLNKLNLRQV